MLQTCALPEKQQQQQQLYWKVKVKCLTMRYPLLSLYIYKYILKSNGVLHTFWGSIIIKTSVFILLLIEDIYFSNSLICRMFMIVIYHNKSDRYDTINKLAFYLTNCEYGKVCHQISNLWFL